MKTLAAALCSLMLLGSQEPQPPTFRSAVDLVPVDVSVLDRNGRPVADLTAGDFALAVDGKPRRIASAQFIAVNRTVEAAPAPILEYDTNAGAAGGRLVMLVIDAGNIAPGRGKAAIDAARRFVARLNRADRVALVTLPGMGPQVDFTSNHALVQALLERAVGRAVDRMRNQRVGIAEALAFQRGDQVTIASVMERECTMDSASSMLLTCRQQLAGESQQMLVQARDRTAETLTGLRYLFDRLASSATPKTLVFISEGLLIEAGNSEISWVAPRAAAAHINMYGLQLDGPEMEASSRTTSPSRAADRDLLREGLDQVVGMTGGDVFRVVANADFAFQRLATELSGYYLLSFEPEPGDRDGRAHKIRIDVRRRDLLLRSRREFSIGTAAGRSADELVVDTLRAPLLAADVPLKLTTYTFRDPDSPRLKVILATDIDRTLNASGTVALGYTLFDDNGKLVSSELERVVSSPIDQRTRLQKYLGAAVVPPGTYTLKVAVVDDGGKRGSVERTFVARINGFGQLHVSDLLIADSAVRGMSGLPPAVAADFTGDELHAYVELFSEVEEQLRGATVVLDVAQTESSRALNSAAARFQQVASPARRVAAGTVPIGLLSPGEYVARAIISVAGRRVGQVTRPFRVARPAATLTAPGAAAPLKPSAPIPFNSRMDAFDKSAVLTPPVVGFFLDRLSAAAASSASSVQPALASLRAGRFDEAMAALERTADDRLAPVFLKGLVLLERGDFNGAAGHFRTALRMDADFYAAAFYLGACHAAAGRDRDAAAAWQASLITDSAAPFVYTLLADALLRAREVPQAIDILMEARTLWPTDPEVGLRLGTALMMASRPAESLKVLEPYLAAHPDDHERLLLVLRALHDARSAGRAIGTAESDKALFIRYADAYALASGPQQALVAEWRKTMEK